jgi:hypothetical protein
MNNILTMARSSRLVEPITKGVTDQRLIFSYGQTIPELDPQNTIYWMGGAFMLKVRRVGLAASLISPGAQWLVDIDEELSGRKIYEGTLEDYVAFGRTCWVKPSEAKIVKFPAGLYSPEQVVKIFSEENFTHKISLQWTEAVLPLNYEHRFFIADGEVITGSPYLVNGKGYSSTIDTSKYEEAKKFANYALKALGVNNIPPAFVMDVALNEDTNKWLIVEANRSWSSGFYGSDPKLALEVVKLGCVPSEDKWTWKPDEHLKQVDEEQEPLRVIPYAELSDQSDVFEYSK